MSSDDLLSIGAFALVSGLSIHALRHYDELGLLRPAVVDPVTGYRRYRPEQVRQARLICALRRVDVPIDAVRVVVDDSDGESLRTVLRQHRERLVDRAQVLSRMVRVVAH
ncbi:MerR family transcriptional regulator [Nonomuraea sp. NPDC046802]|uniref:MerR family transcriptional regulator n=1 Tax=Nonomuraea sp. NPDC046802 TaxID=3154919 RepID=UPI0033F72102